MLCGASSSTAGGPGAAGDAPLDAGSGNRWPRAQVGPEKSPHLGSARPRAGCRHVVGWEGFEWLGREAVGWDPCPPWR